MRSPEILEAHTRCNAVPYVPGKRPLMQKQRSDRIGLPRRERSQVCLSSCDGVSDTVSRLNLGT